MRKTFWLVLLACVVAVPAARLFAAPVSDPQVRGLHDQQRAEMRQLKQQQKTQRNYMRHQRIDPATRAAMNHRMDRERRAMRERHRNQMQELKDQIRISRSAQRQASRSRW